MSTCHILKQLRPKGVVSSLVPSNALIRTQTYLSIWTVAQILARAAHQQPLVVEMIVQHNRLEGAARLLLLALGTRIHTLLFRIAAPTFAAIGCEFAVVWKVCVTLRATFAASFAPSNSQLLCLCTAVSMFERLRMFVFFAYVALQRKLSGSTIHT